MSNTIPELRALFRFLFVATVAYGGAMLWLSPHLPMGDLPQVSGQIALLKDLINGSSPWHDMVRVNFFTPYLVPYFVGIVLAFFFSIVTALKIELAIGYFLFVYACVRLRKVLGGDERLDWLFIPSYFGYAFKWGFVTFLVATPLGVFLILLAKIYADNPTLRNGIVLCLSGVFLFFAHGLVFIFAFFVGCSFLFSHFIKRGYPGRHWAALSIPYFCLAFVFVLFIVVSKLTEQQYVSYGDVSSFSWSIYSTRPAQFVSYMLGSGIDIVFLPISFCLLTYPFLLGSRLKLEMNDRVLPFLMLLILWVTWPSRGMSLYFLCERFSIFSLAFYAMIFSCNKEQGQTQELPRAENVRYVAATTLAVLSCWAFFAVQSVRLVRFAEESADFDRIAAAAEPKRLALSLVFDPGSAAAYNRVAYKHFPAWYQAEKEGFLEPNFAGFLPQVVRYRREMFNEAPPADLVAETFRWKENNGDRYYYIFVRREGGLPPDVSADAKCRIMKIAESGSWSLYRGCGDE